MEIKRIKYPSEEFYKFGSGNRAVSIQDTEIEEWINSCVEKVKMQLENGIESPYAFQASGNSIVICFFSQDVEDDVFNADNYFTIIVAKNYEEGSFFIGDIKEDNTMHKIEEVNLLQMIQKVSDGDFTIGNIIKIGDIELEVKKGKTNESF